MERSQWVNGSLDVIKVYRRVETTSSSEKSPTDDDGKKIQQEENGWPRIKDSRMRSLGTILEVAFLRDCACVVCMCVCVCIRACVCL